MWSLSYVVVFLIAFQRERRPPHWFQHQIPRNRNGEDCFPLGNFSYILHEVYSVVVTLWHP